MMGQQAAAQDRLFYSFNLDAHVPADHLLRRIDRVLDLGDLRQHLAPVLQQHRASLGRPAADDPHADHRLLLRHPSERRLCEEVHLNLAYRWFCRLALDEVVPEH